MIDSFSIIFRHAARNMPVVMSERKELLVAFQSVLKPEHPARPNIDAQLTAIENMEQLQAELPIRFDDSPAKSKGNNH